MFSGLQLKCVRSLADTGFVELRKINVLVGKNSAGKSTFLRTFPLLRQSVEVRTKSPILWYGRLVDFGSFSEAKSKFSLEPRVTFSFRMSLGRQEGRRQRPLLNDFASSYTRPREASFSVELGGTREDEVGYASKFTLEIHDHTISIEFKNSFVRKILINGAECALPKNCTIWAGSENIVPNVSIFFQGKDPQGRAYLSVDNGQLLEQVTSNIHSLAHGNTAQETLRLLAARLSYASKEDFLRQLQNLPGAPYSFRSKVSGLSVDNHYVEELRRSVLIASLPAITSDLNSMVERAALGVRYIAPLRASAERYYRLQDLAVDEIDSRGANTAMLLHSLDAYQRYELSEWMQQNFSFDAYTVESAGHVSVMIRMAGESDGRNIADLGFGFSQVLPVILQLWFSCIRDEYSRPGNEKEASLIAIEQPELHLHPSYQALLADVFAAVSGTLDEKNRRVPLVIETHSEHLVNRLGQKIADGTLRPSDVQVLLFSQADERTRLDSVEFDADGVLGQSWPIGFFLPES